MKRMVENIYGKMPEVSTPSSENLVAKLEEVEADEPLASPLDAVISMDDVASASVIQTNNAGGATGSMLALAEIHPIKKKLKTQPPRALRPFG